MADWVAFSVDLEPNKDDSLDGIAEAMDWFDDVVPRGTVYVTYRIATELPEVIEHLATDHEIGVHVHPREFGHGHDQLAELDADRQRELVTETRKAVSQVARIPEQEVTAFRAGRHSASTTTLDTLSDLSFRVDASINVRYTDYLPRDLTRCSEPFELPNGLFEIPTTYVRPPVLSRPGLRTFPNGVLTATANTIRTDSCGCSGFHAARTIFERATPGVSMYLHPYDATGYHDIENSGGVFRRRFEDVVNSLSDSARFVCASDLA